MINASRGDLEKDFVAILNKHKIPRDNNISDLALAEALTSALPVLIDCILLDRGMQRAIESAPRANAPATPA